MYETLELLSLLTMAGANLALGLYFLVPSRKPWGEAPPEDVECEDFPEWTDEFEHLWWDVNGGEGG